MTAAVCDVVVVDDDTVSRLVLSRVVRRLGHRVREASSFGEALTVAGHGSVDLVLADYLLPDGTGVDLRRELQARGVEAPFVLVTGVAGRGGPDGRSGSERDGLTTLTKPIDSRSVAACLGRVLAEPSR